MSKIRALVCGPHEWCSALFAAGIETQAVEKPTQICDRLKKVAFHVVVLGPDPDYEVVSLIRKTSTGVSIVGVTKDAVEAQLYASGCDEVLSFPLSTVDLVMAVAQGSERGQLVECAAGRRGAEAVRVLDVLARSMDPDAMMSGLLRRLLAVVGGNRASVLLPEGPRGAMVLAAQIGLDDPPSRDWTELSAEVPSAGSVSEWVARERKPVLLSGSVAGDPRMEAPAGRARSALCVPMMTASRLVGVLNLSDTSRDNAFTQEDLDFVSGVASVAAAALDRATLTERIIVANAEWRAAFDAYGLPVALIGPDLTINRVNLTFASAARIRPEEIVGRSLVETLSPSGSALEGAAREAFEKILPVSIQVPHPFEKDQLAAIEIFPRAEGGPATAALVVIRGNNSFAAGTH